MDEQDQQYKESARSEERLHGVGDQDLVLNEIPGALGTQGMFSGDAFRSLLYCALIADCAAAAG